MSVALKDSKSHVSLSFHPKDASLDLFDEALKRLEMIKCTEIGTPAISYGMIFTGLYHNVRFEFNVYVNAKDVSIAKLGTIPSDTNLSHRQIH